MALLARVNPVHGRTVLPPAGPGQPELYVSDARAVPPGRVRDIVTALAAS